MVITKEDVLRFQTLRPSMPENSLALSRSIANAFPLEHVTAIVMGRKRSGKSVYALRVMEDVFRGFGLSEEEAWEMALKCLCYQVEDFIASCHAIIEADKELGGFCHFPVLTIDDAGVGFSHLLRFTEEAQKLKGMFDTVGDLVCGIIYTTPNPGALLNFIRQDPTYRIVIKPSKKGPNWRLAVGYRQMLQIDGKIVYTPMGAPLDSYLVTLEDWRYEQYAKIRRGYSRQAVEDAWKAVSKKKEEDKYFEKSELGEVCDICKKVVMKYRRENVGGLDYIFCPDCYRRWLHPRSEGLRPLNTRTESGDGKKNQDDAFPEQGGLPQVAGVRAHENQDGEAGEAQEPEPLRDDPGKCEGVHRRQVAQGQAHEETLNK